MVRFLRILEELQGILISWDKHAMNSIKSKGSSHWLWCKGYLSIGEVINLIDIYGPHDLEEKYLFWNDLKRINDSIVKEPICLMGDFNIIRWKKDRSRCIYND